MYSKSTRDGLSARQMTIDKTESITSRFRHVKRGILPLLAAVMLVVTSCHEKTNGQDKTKKTDHVADAKSSADKPKVNIKVNRHYDDKGNLIGFDSTYSTFYSNMSGDTVKMDSMMNNFDNYFFRNHSSMFDREFNSLFFNDSLRYPDFFHRDFFMKRYELNDDYFRDMMKRMDSIKNNFYREQSHRKKESREL